MSNAKNCKTCAHFFDRGYISGHCLRTGVNIGDRARYFDICDSDFSGHEPKESLFKRLLGGPL